NDLTNRATKRSVSLQNGQIIRFEVEAKDESSALITIEYRRANRSSEIQSAIEKVKRRFETALQGVTWQEVLGQVAVTFIIILAVSIVPKLLPGMRQSEQIVPKQKQQQEIEKQALGIVPAEPPSNPVRENRSGNPATLVGQVEAPASPPRTKHRRH